MDPSRINAKGLADITQGELKSLEDAAKSLGAKGLAFIKIEGGEWKSPIVKFFSAEEKAALTEKLGIEDGDIIFFAAAEWEQACGILGRVRLDSAALLKKRGKIALRPDDWKFLWVIEFPLMSFDEEHGRYVATHHPFTSPVPEDIELLDSDPKAVREPLRLHAPGFQIRGPTSRWHRLWVGPHRGLTLWHHEHPRRDRFPQNSEGAGPHGAKPDPGHREAAEGATHPDRCASS